MGALDALATLPETLVSALGGVTATVERYTGSTSSGGVTTKSYATAETVTAVVAQWTTQEIASGLIQANDVKLLIPATMLSGRPVPQTRITFGGVTRTVFGPPGETTYAGATAAMYTVWVR